MIQTTFQKTDLTNTVAATINFVGNPDQPSIALESNCLIGSGTDVDLVINDALVAQHHCRIKWQDGYWCISGSQETTHLLVNGRQVQQDSPLCDGDRIKIGSTELEFKITREAIC